LDEVKPKKELKVNVDDITVEDGKVVISNEELAKAFEDQEFSLEAGEGSNNVSYVKVSNKPG